MLTFVLDEVPNYPVDTRTLKFLIIQDAFDRMGDTAQSPCTFPMLSLKVRD